MSQMIKDLIFSLVVSACTAGILAAGIGTLATMLGWIEGNEVLIYLFLMIAVPLFLGSFFMFSRISRKASKSEP
jgi:hypothetical protein